MMRRVDSVGERRMGSLLVGNINHTRDPMDIIVTVVTGRNAMPDNKMLKGSGDFSPVEPIECPEECPFYEPDREDFCQYPPSTGLGCFYDPEDQKIKGE